MVQIPFSAPKEKVGITTHLFFWNKQLLERDLRDELPVKKGVDNSLFNGCEIFDVYQGEHVQEGFKSVAFRVKMQDANATLTDEIIEQQMANIRSVLKKSITEVSFRE